MKILVTGGAGFIGTHLCALLVKEGHSIVVLDLKSKPVEPLQPILGVRYIQGDVRDRAVLATLLDSVDVVYHLAAIVSVPVCQNEIENGYSTNLGGTVALLDVIQKKFTSKQLPHFIFASTFALYGHEGKLGQPIRELDVAVNPLSYYGAQKLASEHAIQLFHAQTQMPATIFRFANVYGYGQDPASPYSGVISIYLKKAKNSEPLTVYGDGQQTRDFVSVNDLVRALRDSLFQKKEDCKGLPMNLCTGNSLSILALAEIFTKILNPALGAIQFAPAREGDVRFSQGSFERAKKVLNWEPTVELLSGIRELYT